MSEKHTCPRRAEVGMDQDDSPLRGAGTNKDTWDVRKTDGAPQCSFCGSVSPEYFLASLTVGEELGVTDKDYKAYLDSGAEHYKFYFQHFSKEQRQEFVGMLNRRIINFGWPGQFTRLPYFLRVAGS